MAIEGPISELNLIDLFQILSFNQKTGILYIEPSDQKKAKVYFDNGSVVFVDQDGHNIGVSLIKSGIINKEQYENIMQKVSMDETAFASEILNKGILNEQAFRKFLRTRVENTIFSLFETNEGYFKFEEGAFTLNDLFRYKIKTESLIMEGSRRIDEWSRLSSKIPSTELKPVLSDNPDKMDVIDLDPKEWEILSMINGDNSIRDIAEKFGNEFEIAKLIYGMITLGIVKVFERTGGEATSDLFTRGKQYFEDGLYDKSITELKVYIKDNPNNAEAYIIICSAFYALRQYGKINDYAETAFKNGIDDLRIRKYNAVAYYRQGSIVSASKEWNIVREQSNEEGVKSKTAKLINLLEQAENLTNELIGG